MFQSLLPERFPRVVFTFWGGIRYGFGLLAILFAIYAFKKKKNIWIFYSGIASVLALLTSVEVGVCSIFSVIMGLLIAFVFSLYDKSIIYKYICSYFFGLIIVLFPYGVYLLTTGSLIPYVDSIYSVITIMAKVFPDSSFADHPKNFIESLAAMSPLSPHFKHLTPAYCFLFAFYLYAYSN